ncbi:helix-turn-helix domain-containing protein [Cohnella massiliensis]|uniref:helix-turn-helix domain-containing protein n=1 Tax=Cohnella massiliensis TaxID=1816691 RepID=UPI001FE2B96A|nr:helix-turn-helix transcriptional regulator [Cohnella massiliensis]
MKILVKDVGELKKLLLIKGFTQRSLGREIGISEPYATQIVNGTRNPGPQIAKKITDALDVDFDTIFFIDSGCKSNQESPTLS